MPRRVWHYARLGLDDRPRYWPVSIDTREDVVVSLVDPLIDRPFPDELLAARKLADFPRVVLDCDFVILRGTSARVLHGKGASLSQLETTLSKKTGRTVRVATLCSNVQADSPFMLSLESVSDPPPNNLLPKIRELEMYGNLRRCHAIHRPHNAHTELPSGAHASVFVRVADVLDSAQTIERLADWFPARTCTSGVILSDTWTLLPLLQELRYRSAKLLRAADGSVEMPTLMTFDQYPSRSDVEVMFDRISTALRGPDPRLAVVLSTVSSGAMVEQVRSLSKRLSVESMPVVALVNAAPNDFETESFVRMGGIERYDVHRGEPCSLCLEPQKRAVVVIDSKRYSERVEPQLAAEMLKAKSAQYDRNLWEAADAASAVRVHVEDPRRERHLAVWLDIPTLLEKNQSWRQARIDDLHRLARDCDLVVVPTNSSTGALRSLVAQAFPGVKVFECDDVGDERDGIKDALSKEIQGKTRILIIDDVLITGSHIRVIHRLIQETIKDLDASERRTQRTISAYVLVARAAHYSTWESLRDSFRQTALNLTLEHGHLTYLPDPGDCPWCDERDLLERVRHSSAIDQLTSNDRATALHHIDARFEMLARAAGDGLISSLYLCGATGEMGARDPGRITGRSVFGEDLHEATAFAAVTSAMLRQRDELGRAETAHHGRAWFWNAPKIIGAYHDPLLQVAFLRSAREPELNVPSNRGLRSIIRNVMARESKSPILRQWSLVAAEHVLALAMRKYPSFRRHDIEKPCMSLIEANGGPIGPVLRAIVRTELGKS